MDIYEEYQEKHNQFEKFKRYVDEYNKNPLVQETYLNEDGVRYCKTAIRQSKKPLLILAGIVYRLLNHAIAGINT